MYCKSLLAALLLAVHGLAGAATFEEFIAGNCEADQATLEPEAYWTKQGNCAGYFAAVIAFAEEKKLACRVGDYPVAALASLGRSAIARKPALGTLPAHTQIVAVLAANFPCK